MSQDIKGNAASAGGALTRSKAAALGAQVASPSGVGATILVGAETSLREGLAAVEQAFLKISQLSSPKSSDLVPTLGGILALVKKLASTLVPSDGRQVSPGSNLSGLEAAAAIQRGDIRDLESRFSLLESRFGYRILAVVS